MRRMCAPRTMTTIDVYALRLDRARRWLLFSLLVFSPLVIGVSVIGWKGCHNIGGTGFEICGDLEIVLAVGLSVLLMAFTTIPDYAFARMSYRALMDFVSREYDALVAAGETRPGMIEVDPEEFPF
jgi:hypothetical protein